ncbi:hypothetical protein TELCIR_23724, partial [Teladorsagia circumcincta]
NLSEKVISEEKKTTVYPTLSAEQERQLSASETELAKEDRELTNSQKKEIEELALERQHLQAGWREEFWYV